MCRIRDAGKVKARDRIAVLAALNVAFEVKNTQRGAGLRGVRHQCRASGERCGGRQQQRA